jgi:malate synthase
MEDAATAEISRAQLWQWVTHHATLADGRVVTRDLFDRLLKEEMVKLRDTLGGARYDAGQFGLACDLFAQMTHSRRFTEFLTLTAYEYL